MEHRLKITVGKKPRSDGVVGIRNVSVREKPLRFLLGENRNLTIIVPGDTVHELSIHELEGGMTNEQNERTCAAHR